MRRVKEESEKGAWNSTFKKQVMTSSSITLWKTGGWKVEEVTAFILLGSQITVDGDCSKIKRCLLLGKLGQTKQHVEKQRHHFPNKGLIVKALIFPVVMYTCESWTIKKAECRRTDACKLWWWRRVVSPLASKEVNPEYSLERLMPRLQYFGHLMQKAKSLEKTLMLVKIEEEKGAAEDEVVR